MPSDHTLGGAAFEVIGTDFAGPILYKLTSRRQGKAYLVIFSCSLSQAVHLELVPSLKTGAFLPCLKRLIARRGGPRVIYSDNGSTFVKAAKWLKQVREDKKLQGYLESHDIEWKFNLSRAPWWGGQFERLIGVVKKAMHKVIGRGSLFWNELINVLLEVETQVSRPCSITLKTIQIYQSLHQQPSCFSRPRTFLKSRPGASQTRTYPDEHDSFRPARITCGQDGNASI